MKCIIERKSSLEKEPQTLSLDQLQYARDAALCVLSTHSMEDAIRIFTEGLEPVNCAKNNGNIITNSMMDSNEDVVVDHVLAELRDAVTAPF